MLKRTLFLATLLALAVTACDAEVPATGVVQAEAPLEATGDSPGGVPEQVLAPIESEQRAPARGYIAHEWGTFTSVQASDGTTLGGLQHEDEPLPDFVHRRVGLSPHMGKGVSQVVGTVTQKLETPVIYFHTLEPMTVRVDVDFPKGILGEWYPRAASVVPELLLLAPTVANTKLGWNAVLEPNPDRSELLPVHDDDIWAPSREVDCAMVRNGPGDSDMFIFYRGIGDFVMPIKVTHGVDGLLRVSNLSQETIPAAVLLHNDGIQGGVVHIGQIDPGQTVTAEVTVKDRAMEDYLGLAQDILQIALEADGLFTDEALAMVNTWTHSYFQTPGVRLLYITPKTWTDELLPLTLDPPPEAIVRTMVGRIEVLTRESESQATALLTESFQAPQGMDKVMAQSHPENATPMMELLHERFGRFAEPRVRRAIEQLPPGPMRDWAQQILELLNVRVHMGNW